MNDKRYKQIEERLLQGKEVSQKDFINYLAHGAGDMVKAERPLILDLSVIGVDRYNELINEEKL